MVNISTFPKGFSLDTTRFPWSSCSASLGSSWALVGSHRHCFREIWEHPGRSAAFVHRLCRGEDNEDVKPGEMKRTITFSLWATSNQSLFELFDSFYTWVLSCSDMGRKQYLSFKSLSPPAESEPEKSAAKLLHASHGICSHGFAWCLWRLQPLALAIMTKMNIRMQKAWLEKSFRPHTHTFTELWPLDCPLKHVISFKIFWRKELPGGIILSNFQKILLSALKKCCIFERTQ